MSDWQCKLDLTDIWNKHPGEITIQELCKIISDRLSKLVVPEIDEIEYDHLDLCDEFEILSTDKEATVEEFDEIMQDLYDWGDTSLDNEFAGKKICWIATNF